MFNQEIFKEAMSAFASGVTIVTMKGAVGSYHGLTVSAFTSVSLDPPMVLFCRKKPKDVQEALGVGDIVVINILSQGQEDLAYRFANPKLDPSARYSEVDFELFEGVPVLLNARAALGTTIRECHEAGDHSIYLCEVHHARVIPDSSPLVYYNRAFHSLLTPESV